MTYQVTFPAQVWQIFSHAMQRAEQFYDGRVYDSVPPENTEFPCLVFQSQDLGGRNAPSLGLNGWNGLVTLRSISYSQQEAYDKLAQATAALSSNVVVSGILTVSGTYNVQIFADRPLPFPVDKLTEGALFQAGVLVVAYIRPNI